VEVAFPNLSFVRPVDLQQPADGTNRLFVVEQRGVISVFERDTNVSTKNTFLDIQSRVRDIGNEEGLLGLAFHPDYASNGYFYLNYTASDPRRTVIARYTVSTTAPNVANEDSAWVILEIEQPFINHNGGGIAFGPDGYLYIGMGDGGSGGDPLGSGQDLNTLLGAMLRIDVNTTDGAKNYGIPDSNPFAGNSNGFREEIYAYGLRNPWRFSFDPVTGWLWAGDVGQNAYEEIDIIQSGKNYGWNVMEGLHCFSPRVGCETRGLALPIWEYDHSVGQSITGGLVYHGANVSELNGAYIYADFVSGRLWALRYDGSNSAENTELLKTNLSIASFGIDRNSELYICAFDGKIYRLKPTALASPWDVNGDTIIDLFDLISVAQHFGQQPSENTRADVNQDGQVNIFDLILVAGHFGESAIAATPARKKMPTVEHAPTLEGWLTEARLVNDGSMAFQRGIEVLQRLLSGLVPSETVLLPNYPNPFNPETWIPFHLATDAAVTLTIYDQMSRVVRTRDVGFKPAGVYESKDRAIYWDGRNDFGERVVSGIYFYHLGVASEIQRGVAGDYHATRRMIILK
jgi:glucose/arabinose dehydrogenase